VAACTVLLSSIRKCSRLSGYGAAGGSFHKRAYPLEQMIMEHRETRTLWQQATGAAIFGPLSGHTLEMLPAQQRRWGAVRNRRGLTLAAEPESAAAAPFAAELGFRLLKSATDRITTPWRTRLSKRLPLRETVFGIRIGNASRAYPLSEISDGDGFEDEVAGVRLALNYDPATGLLAASGSPFSLSLPEPDALFLDLNATT
jgi:hypothetical protein